MIQRTGCQCVQLHSCISTVTKYLVSPCTPFLDSHARSMQAHSCIISNVVLPVWICVERGEGRGGREAGMRARGKGCPNGRLFLRDPSAGFSP